jgi:hypothetical protein
VDITAEIITAFRTAYPLFSNATAWPDSVLTMALCEGDAESGGKNWGGYVDDCHNFKQRGMFLYAAHWLVTTYPKGATDTSDQSAQSRNPISAKSVGDESVTYAVLAQTSATASGSGWLQSTSFGQQFTRLRKRAGMGALAV